MLTARQSSTLRFIHDYAAKHGQAPSFRDMMAGLGLASKSQVHRLLSSLEARGYIRRLPYRARAIEVVRGADGNCPTCGQPPSPPNSAWSGLSLSAFGRRSRSKRRRDEPL